MEWSRKTFGQRKIRMVELQQLIGAIQNSNNPEELYDDQALINELEHLWHEEELFWGQRSKVK